jgi:hypothetical protein
MKEAVMRRLRLQSYKWFFSYRGTSQDKHTRLGSQCRPLRCEILEPRHLLSGVTLITHGFNSSVDDWVTTMADAIAARSGLTSDQPRYRVDVTDPGHDGGPPSVVNTSRSGPAPSDHTGDTDIVILLNWSDVAGKLTFGGGYHRSTVESPHVVHFPVGNADKTRNIAAQVDERMQLYRAFASAKTRPGEQRQAQVDCRGIEGVGCCVQIHGKAVVDVKFLGGRNQHVGKIGVDSPVAMFVGVGQRAPGDTSAKTGVIQLWSHRSQARFNVPQAFAVGQLCESHADKLIETRKSAGARIASIMANAIVELVPRKEIHQLSEDELPDVHSPSPSPP